MLQYHKATTQVWAELARNLADSYILPFDVESFATAIESYALLVEFKHGSLMRDHGLAKRLGNYVVVANSIDHVAGVVRVTTVVRTSDS